MLVNNAGIGSVASIEKADVDEMEAMTVLNITALTRLTYAVAPALVKRGSGTIINVGSVVGIAVEALNGVYSASKSYVLSFGHSLQRPGRQGRAHPDRAAWRDGNRVLGRRRLPGAENLSDHHVGRGSGRRRARGPRPGGAGHHPRSAGRRGLDALGGGSSRSQRKIQQRQAFAAVRARDGKRSLNGAGAQIGSGRSAEPRALS